MRYPSKPHKPTAPDCGHNLKRSLRNALFNDALEQVAINIPIETTVGDAIDIAHSRMKVGELVHSITVNVDTYSSSPSIDAYYYQVVDFEAKQKRYEEEMVKYKVGLMKYAEDLKKWNKQCEVELEKELGLLA